jgi:hypothetical protein
MGDTARLYLTVNSGLEKKFREEVAKRLGMKKGNLQVAIEEAIELWIKVKNHGGTEKRRQQQS